MNKEDLKRSFDRIDTDKQPELYLNKQKKPQKRSRLIGAVAASCAFIMITAFILTGIFVNYGAGSENSVLFSVSSREEIFKVIDDYNKQLNIFQNGKNGGFKDEIGAASPESDMKGDNALNSENSYTKTNTQVAGVDEGDIVKADGKSIYKLSQNGFIIVDVDNGDMKISCEIKRQNYVPLELYVNGDKLVMIGGVYEYFYYGGGRKIMPEVDCCSCLYYYKTEIAVYSIKDKINPVLQRSVTIDGYYLTSRMIGSKVYYMLDYGFYYGNQESYIPKIKDSKIGEKEEEIKISDIYYFKDVPLFNYTVLGYINLTDTNDLSQKAYLGAGGETYVNLENIYVAANDYSGCVRRNIFGYFNFDFSKTRTRILKFNLNTLMFSAASKVEGTIKDRYSLDEYGGNLRVATTTAANWADDKLSYSTVFVLDKDLKQIGKVSDIGLGESIYSVRFKEKQCIVVTFLVTDPLYIVDLSNPYNPTVNSGLKEDGVSFYLHYVGDTGLIIGLGRDTEEIGGMVTWKGLKISLYKEVGGELVNLDTKTIGTAWSSAEALYNPKAIMTDFENPNYMFFGFACEVWDYSGSFGDYYNYSLTTQSFYLFRIDFLNEKFFEPDILTNFTGGLNYNYAQGDEAFYSWYDNYYSYIKRSVAIGNYVYTISDKYITSYSLDDLSTVVCKLKIAEFTPAKDLFGY